MSSRKVSLRAAARAGFSLLVERPGLSFVLGIGSFLLFDNLIFLLNDSQLSAIKDFFMTASFDVLFLCALGFFFLFLLRTWIYIPLCKLSLDAIDNPRTEIAFSWPTVHEFLGAINAFILSFVYTIAGLTLFIIPGFIVSTRFSFFLYDLIDMHLNGSESLKVSWELTRGNVFRLLIFSFVCLMLNIIAAYPYGVGLLVSAPFELFASAHLYRQLVKKSSTL